ncbi:MAG TPA: hypothetical protein VIE43_03185 [Thermoanaerobaculia bacterium]|jgi:hypothetical protein|nr:hypothetical protein [Thermoanaerobaculia bacterium]
MSQVSARRPILLIAPLLLSAVVPAFAANTGKQTPPIQLGTSGGSANDISAQYCCAGTLGSLVTRDGVQYILSNNHVLARSGSAVTGENIIQPGLVDSNCSAAGDNVVATFPGNIVPLGHNTDTALGKVIAGKVNTAGTILGVGAPCTSTVAPTIGLKVTKAGRTTGTTTGTIQAINVSATVQYETQCNAGSTFNESYTNQVSVTPGTTFSGGGDSGSLILSNTNTSNRHPVALLFAGSSSVTIGNPISAVVAAYTAGGHTFSFVGKSCSSLAAEELLVGPSQADVEHTRLIKEDHEKELFTQKGVIGVGVGRMTDDAEDSEAAIIVYVQMDGKSLPRGLKLPKELDGIKVRVIPTDPFVAR